jgi:hypothetical protein
LSSVSQLREVDAILRNRHRVSIISTHVTRLLSTAIQRLAVDIIILDEDRINSRVMLRWCLSRRCCECSAARRSFCRVLWILSQDALGRPLRTHCDTNRCFINMLCDHLPVCCRPFSKHHHELAHRPTAMADRPLLFVRSLSDPRNNRSHHRHLQILRVIMCRFFGISAMAKMHSARHLFDPAVCSFEAHSWPLAFALALAIAKVPPPAFDHS